MDDPVDNKPPTFWQMLHSVMAAAFGVQKYLWEPIGSHRVSRVA